MDVEASVRLELGEVFTRQDASKGGCHEDVFAGRVCLRGEGSWKLSYRMSCLLAGIQGRPYLPCSKLGFRIGGVLYPNLV